jgi:hypothetical protein
MNMPHPDTCTTVCSICHMSLRETSYELLSSLKVWHLFEEHNDVYQQIFGPVHPLEPDPRTKRGRARILKREQTKWNGPETPPPLITP